MNEEVLAGIKVLVGIARADGHFHDNEAVAIRSALDGADLGPDVTIEKLLQEEVDLDAEIGKIRSNEARRSTFEAACAMVYVDGEAAESEREILEKLRRTWEVQRPQSAAQRLTKALKQDWLPGSIAPIDDPVKRDATIDDIVLRSCIRAAIFGAIPVPFVGEFLVSFVGVQTLQSIGALYGHTRDAAFWKAFAGNFAGATAARIAIVSLMKLVPGWGSVVGATGAYAATWALAQATRHYFEKGAAMDPSALREVFAQAKKEGAAKAKAASAEIAAESKRIEGIKAQLDADLAAGKITEAEYAEGIAKS